MRSNLRKSMMMRAVQASLAGALLASALILSHGAAAQSSTQMAASKTVGTVKSVSRNSIVLTNENGAEATVTFADSARIMRAAPGQTDLKTAAPIQISDIQVGDRVAARGQAGDAGALFASVAIVMKQGDIAHRQQAQTDEWRRGIGGIVKDVNPSGGTVVIANSLAAGSKPILIHVGPGAEIKRYSPDSVKFEDAKPGTLDQIKAGDQLRARGTKNADGAEFTAQAIVSGSFRDIAGTVVSTDATNQSITISDLMTKKPVTVMVGPDSQLRKLPQFVAMGIAMRLKGGTPGVAAGDQGSATQGGQPSAAGRENWHGARSGAAGADSQASASGMRGGQNGNAMRGQGAGWRGNGSGPPDFQQMLARIPAVSITDLNKGDAVMLVATEGSANSQPTAITLLSGVEPILSAAPAGTNAASTILSPWNLGQPAGTGGEGPGQ
ncbi:MAG TPA: hypothetical protein VKM56_06535 [Verrucomicrobiae bacterium]|nr:hypothetical protein [Verrucomicrobiae bacterium]